jgi:very-short-patch-repair endonuclease
MKPLVRATMDAYLAGHYGVVSHERALALGLTPQQVYRQVESGRWVRLHRGVYLAASHPRCPESQIVAACQAVRGAVASHVSAAWLWALVPSPPARSEITVPIGGVSRRQGITVHRSGDLDPDRVLIHRAIPVTDPLRTLVDLAASAPKELDDAVDRALSRRILTVQALEAEHDRLARPGRKGVRTLREALKRRGLVQAPTASVLESRVLRLLRQWRITPLGVEVVVADGRYRIDVMLAPGLALEVDGYAFHWSPEAKAADSQRRNRLALQGIRVVEADWVTVMRHPDQLREAIEAALSQSRPAVASA